MSNLFSLAIYFMKMNSTQFAIINHLVKLSQKKTWLRGKKVWIGSLVEKKHCRGIFYDWKSCCPKVLFLHGVTNNRSNVIRHFAAKFSGPFAWQQKKGLCGWFQTIFMPLMKTLLFPIFWNTSWRAHMINGDRVAILQKPMQVGLKANVISWHNKKPALHAKAYCSKTGGKSFVLQCLFISLNKSLIYTLCQEGKHRKARKSYSSA